MKEENKYMSLASRNIVLVLLPLIALIIISIIILLSVFSVLKGRVVCFRWIFMSGEHAPPQLKRLNVL